MRPLYSPPAAAAAGQCTKLISFAVQKGKKMKRRRGRRTRQQHKATFLALAAVDGHWNAKSIERSESIIANRRRSMIECWCWCGQQQLRCRRKCRQRAKANGPTIYQSIQTNWGSVARHCRWIMHKHSFSRSVVNTKTQLKPPTSNSSHTFGQTIGNWITFPLIDTLHLQWSYFCVCVCFLRSQSVLR